MRDTREIMADLARSGLTPDQLVLVMELSAALGQPQRTTRQDRNARYYQARKQRLKASETSELRRLKTGSDAFKTLSDAPPRPLDDVDPLTSTVVPSLNPQKEKDPKGSQKKEGNWPSDYREQVWQAYGQGREKKVGIAKLDEVRKSGKVAWEPLMAAIRHQAQTVEPQFRPSLERFLKKERWLDDYEPEPTGPPNSVLPFPLNASSTPKKREMSDVLAEIKARNPYFAGCR
jgi:hypothetical protein